MISAALPRGSAGLSFPLVEQAFEGVVQLPPASIRSACVPTSTIRPASKTTMRGVRRTVESRCHV